MHVRAPRPEHESSPEDDQRAVVTEMGALQRLPAIRVAATMDPLSRRLDGNFSGRRAGFRTADPWAGEQRI